MGRVLFGEATRGETSKLQTILHDANIPYFFTEVGHKYSEMRAALEVLSNSNILPIMVDEGVTYIGFESIRKHCGKIS